MAQREPESRNREPNGFHPCLCFNLRQAARQITAFYDGRLAKAGLTASQFALLTEIASGTDKPVSDLALKMALDPSTLSRNLRPLEESGLIEMFTDPANRRLHRVRVTPAGRGRMRDGLEAWRSAQSAAAQVLPEGLVQEVLKAAGRLPGTANPGRPKRRRPGASKA
jgi:DNA-binding MarR family transcriptional regulator